MPARDDDAAARGLGDAQRLADLDDSGLADSPPEEVFDRYTRTVARALGVPVALVSVVDGERQFFKSQVGLPEPWATERGTALSHSFCQHVVTGDAPFLVRDARTDERVQGNGAIEDLDVIGYAGVPVHGPGGLPVGALCAITHEPREWQEDEVRLLQDLAAAAHEMIALRAAAAAQRTVVAELSHHLRTGLTALQLEAADLEAGTTPQESQQRAALLSDALRTQADVVDGLLRSAAAAGRSRTSHADLLPLLEDVARRASGGPRAVRVAPAAPVAVTVPAAPLARLLDELVALLLDHGAGDVTLTVLADASAVRVRVCDESLGLPGDVVARATARRDHADADARVSIAEQAVACGGRLVQTSSRPTAWDVLLPPS